MYKLLVAEGETVERRALCKTLADHLGENLSVYEAGSDWEALEIFEREAPQIAILDIGMPGIGGLGVAEKIRKSQRPCGILLLTEFDELSYAKRASALRALAYLRKPCDEKELIRGVEEAMYLLSRLTGEPVPEEKSGGNARLSLVREEIRDFIAAHYREELSMQDVAKAMRYSDAYFCKLFKRCFHVNFSAYLNEFRVEKAKKMMMDPRANVKDISVACGYHDSNYFSRVFKRITGQTPSEYRLSVAGKALKVCAVAVPPSLREPSPLSDGD